MRVVDSCTRPPLASPFRTSASRAALAFAARRDARAHPARAVRAAEPAFLPHLRRGRAVAARREAHRDHRALRPQARCASRRDAGPRGAATRHPRSDADRPLVPPPPSTRARRGGRQQTHGAEDRSRQVRPRARTRGDPLVPFDQARASRFKGTRRARPDHSRPDLRRAPRRTPRPDRRLTPAPARRSRSLAGTGSAWGRNRRTRSRGCSVRRASSRCPLGNCGTARSPGGARPRLPPRDAL